MDMNGTVGGRLGQHLGHRLAAGHVGAQGLGQMGRRGQVQLAHHRHEFGPLALLQPRIVGDLGADGGMAAALVVVGGIDQQCRVQLQQLAEQAVIERVGIAGGKVGAARCRRSAGCRR